jgi:hypothetical protein
VHRFDTISVCCTLAVQLRGGGSCSTGTLKMTEKGNQEHDVATECESVAGVNQTPSNSAVHTISFMVSMLSTVAIDHMLTMDILHSWKDLCLVRPHVWPLPFLHISPTNQAHRVVTTPCASTTSWCVQHGQIISAPEATTLAPRSTSVEVLCGLPETLTPPLGLHPQHGRTIKGATR